MWSWQRAQWTVRLTKVDMVLATMSSRSMQPGLELVDGPLAQLDVADEVPGAGRDEPGRDHAPRVARLEHVAGNLLADEPADTACRR